MDTETLTITKINEDNYQLITVHDQTGSASSINLSKSCYEQLRAHFLWEGKTLNDASALPIPDVSSQVCKHNYIPLGEPNMSPLRCKKCGDQIY